MCRADLGLGWKGQFLYSGDGLGWYRKKISVPAGLKHKHIYLYFDAVDEQAWVSVDGKLIYEHTEAATGKRYLELWVIPFSADVAELIKPGQSIQVAVRIHSEMGEGGIYQPVFLIGSDVPLTTKQITDLVKVRNPWRTQMWSSTMRIVILSLALVTLSFLLDLWYLHFDTGARPRF